MSSPPPHNDSLQYNRDGMAALATGDVDDSKELLDTALEILCAQLGKAKADHNKLGLGDPADKALEPRTRELVGQQLGAGMASLLMLTHNNIASWWRVNGDSAQALRSLGVALSEGEAMGSASNKDLATTHSNLAATLSEMGRHSLALEYARAAVLHCRLALDEADQASSDRSAAERGEGEWKQQQQQLQSGSVPEVMNTLAVACHNLAVEIEFVQGAATGCVKWYAQAASLARKAAAIRDDIPASLGSGGGNGDASDEEDERGAEAAAAAAGGGKGPDSELLKRLDDALASAKRKVAKIGDAKQQDAAGGSGFAAVQRLSATRRPVSAPGGGVTRQAAAAATAPRPFSAVASSGYGGQRRQRQSRGGGGGGLRFASGLADAAAAGGMARAATRQGETAGAPRPHSTCEQSARSKRKGGGGVSVQVVVTRVSNKPQPSWQRDDGDDDDGGGGPDFEETEGKENASRRDFDFGTFWDPFVGGEDKGEGDSALRELAHRKANQKKHFIPASEGGVGSVVRGDPLRSFPAPALAAAAATASASPDQAFSHGNKARLPLPPRSSSPPQDGGGGREEAESPTRYLGGTQHPGVVVGGWAGVAGGLSRTSLERLPLEHPRVLPEAPEPNPKSPREPEKLWRAPSPPPDFQKAHPTLPTAATTTTTSPRPQSATPQQRTEQRAKVKEPGSPSLAESTNWAASTGKRLAAQASATPLSPLPLSPPPPTAAVPKRLVKTAPPPLSSPSPSKLRLAAPLAGQAAANWPWDLPAPTFKKHHPYLDSPAAAAGRVAAKGLNKATEKKKKGAFGGKPLFPFARDAAALRKAGGSFSGQRRGGATALGVPVKKKQDLSRGRRQQQQQRYGEKRGGGFVANMYEGAYAPESSDDDDDEDRDAINARADGAKAGVGGLPWNGSFGMTASERHRDADAELTVLHGDQYQGLHEKAAYFGRRVEPIYRHRHDKQGLGAHWHGEEVADGEEGGGGTHRQHSGWPLMPRIAPETARVMTRMATLAHRPDREGKEKGEGKGEDRPRSRTSRQPRTQNKGGVGGGGAVGGAVGGAGRGGKKGRHPPVDVATEWASRHLQRDLLQRDLLQQPRPVSAPQTLNVARHGGVPVRRRKGSADRMEHERLLLAYESAKSDALAALFISSDDDAVEFAIHRSRRSFDSCPSSPVAAGPAGEGSVAAREEEASARESGERSKAGADDDDEYGDDFENSVAAGSVSGKDHQALKQALNAHSDDDDDDGERNNGHDGSEDVGQEPASPALAPVVFGPEPSPPPSPSSNKPNAQPPLPLPQSYVGRSVEKLFEVSGEMKPFAGKVVGFTTSEEEGAGGGGVVLYSVLYEDGDEDEIELSELEAILLQLEPRTSHEKKESSSADANAASAEVVGLPVTPINSQTPQPDEASDGGGATASDENSSGRGDEASSSPPPRSQLSTSANMSAFTPAPKPIAELSVEQMMLTNLQRQISTAIAMGDLDKAAELNAKLAVLEDHI